MYTGRRPALIPSNVQLSVDDYKRIKNCTGRYPFPPPDATPQTHQDGYRTQQLHALGVGTQEAISWDCSAQPFNTAVNEEATQLFASPKTHSTEISSRSKLPTCDSLAQESESHWGESKHKPVTIFQNEDRCFSVDVRHTSELEPSDDEFWQAFSPGHASAAKESINPFDQPGKSSTKSMRLPIPHSNDSWNSSSLCAISPRDTSAPTTWGT